jgi:DNA-binding MarR family transcriptional regulator
MVLPPNTNDEHLIFGLLFLLSNKLQTIGDALFKEITTKQWFITLVLSILEGKEPTLNELSEAAGTSRQNVKQLILKLEKKGFVDLRRDEQDSRKFRIKLTPACYQFFESTSDKSREFMARLFGSLDPDELKTTAATLIKLASNLEEMEKDYV